MKNAQYDQKVILLDFGMIKKILALLYNYAKTSYAIRINISLIVREYCYSIYKIIQNCYCNKIVIMVLILNQCEMNALVITSPECS